MTIRTSGKIMLDADAYLQWDRGTSTLNIVSNGVTVMALTSASVVTPDSANVAALGGTLTGTTDGDLADVADIALSTSDTYTDSAVNTAVNTAIASTNLQVKEIQTVVNAIITSLIASGIMASS